MTSRHAGVLVAACLWLAPLLAIAQEESAEPSPVRGSIVEDRAARALLEAGDARLDSDETDKAVEVWESVIERYPASRVRFEAHLRLGQHFLERQRSYDRARQHYEIVAQEANPDDEQRAEASLQIGVCYYEAGNFGKTFQVMRDVIEQFPVSEQVNLAYYYIGLGHFQQGHYSRAIDALEKVGTALTDDDDRSERVLAGKRLFIKIEDADLAALEPGQGVMVRVETTGGDAEEVECLPVGRNVRLVLGSVLTGLGAPEPGNNRLEVRGDDEVKVTYLDEHTADKQFGVSRIQSVPVVSDAVVTVTDGAFRESLRGVVLGREANLQVIDLDRHRSAEADTIQATVEIWREKSAEEMEAERTAILTQQATERAEGGSAFLEEEAAEPEIDRYKKIDEVKVTLTESEVEPQQLSRALPTPDEPDSANPPSLSETSENPGQAGPQEPQGIYTGVFRGKVMIEASPEPKAGDPALQAKPGDQMRLRYQDETNSTLDSQERLATARLIEGNIGGVRVTRAEIGDQELRIKTTLETASALTAIGNRYKEFGLKTNADGKYNEALAVCEDVLPQAKRLGGKLLEESYVRLWTVYYEMEQYNLAAAMADRLQREFPTSGFVDDALLKLADITREQGEPQKAIGIYSRLVSMQSSDLRGEAQFGIAECYEAMAQQAEGPGAAQMFDRAFQEYKQVYERFPDSGRIGEAVAKMANYYYQQQDFARAIDVFESVLTEHPDAKFLDVILFNYGRCLFRMNRTAEARRKFDQLIAEFPESPLATDSKRISEALARQGR
jgi:TolA-binding protein